MKHWQSDRYRMAQGRREQKCLNKVHTTTVPVQLQHLYIYFLLLSITIATNFKRLEEEEKGTVVNKALKN